MELDIKRIPDTANTWTVTRAIAAVVHSDEFGGSPEPNGRLLNFQVKLNPSALGGVRNNGSGVLIVCDVVPISDNTSTPFRPTASLA